MPDPIVFVVVACCLLFAGFTRLSELLIVQLSRRGKVRVVWVDPDSGGLSVEFVKREGNEIPAKGPDGPRRYILDGKARFSGQWPTWIVHARHGWNFTGPTDAETVQSNERLRVLAISNPSSYHHAITHNEARDALEANKDEDSWIVKVAPFALIALLMVMVGVGYLVVKVGQAANKAGASG
jgi:hypothetical protein